MGEPLNGFAGTLPLAVVRQRIAELVLARRPPADTSVGDVALWPHQRNAVARLRMAIAEFGGALLADDVGTGKTFVALAIASGYASPLVVAPAGLREGWWRAAERAGRVVSFVSFESLSRGRRPGTGHDFVIVDEAHHCRNPRATRYGALASLLVNTPVLLLSATPIHNRRNDLVALLALFLGASASALGESEIARCVVRRSRDVLASAGALPRIVGPISIATHLVDDITPDAILALPPPLPAADGGTAGALLSYTLLRQWASSQGALLAGIRRRLAVAHALSATLDDGRYPTRAELAAWTLGDDAQQLAMGALLSPADQRPPRAELRDAVVAHMDGLRALRRAALAHPDIDRHRALRLRELWTAHPGERSIAFSQFAETIDAYWRELRTVPRACALTARGARTAGGAISRGAALGSFRPGHGGDASTVDYISALLTTDLASEGLDLHDASVLIHLDLPWTPARLEQRVGRIVRPGSPHALAHLYAMEPPIGAAALLDIRHRLVAKLAAARSTLGAVMSGIGIELELDRSPTAPTTAAERLEAILGRWRSAALTPNGDCPDVSQGSGDVDGRAAIAPAIAVAHAAGWGWLALVAGDRARLVASLDGASGDNPRFAVRICDRIDTLPDGREPPPPSPGPAIARATEQLRSWLDARRGSALAGIDDMVTVRGRRRALTTIARLADAPASARAVLSESAGRALAAAGRPLGAGSERLLLELDAERATSPAGWLDAVGRLAPPAQASRAQGSRTEERLLALIVLSPEP